MKKPSKPDGFFYLTVFRCYLCPIMDLKHVRKDYSKHTLNIEDVDEPIEFFKGWLLEAKKTEPEATAVILSTSENNHPSSRVVLLKEITSKGFVFYTNYNSRKGQELKSNPYASLLFFWPSQERQVRIQGRVEQISREESVAYFKSRPVESQIGAMISVQSEPIEHRDELVKRFDVLKNNPDQIECPPHWGGLVLAPVEIEFWQGRPSRVHDRVQCQKKESGWVYSRLQP
jgi:pyridoxamine 5'-phosphate oxidase